MLRIEAYVCPRRMFRPARIALLPAVAATLLVGSTAPASDSLATPITTEMADVTWPVKVEVEIANLDAQPDQGSETDAALSKREVVVPDGHRLSFESSVRSNEGRLDFDLRVVPRIHPRGAVELEWDLLVSEAKYRPMGVGRYAIHRLQLAGEPELGPATLSIARSDIVSTTDEPFVEEVEIDGQVFEIRISAQSMRG